ncbi:MAG TPA: YebC/PmpR family DNA-binding transcriptional regulator [Planctomycetota bacterium]|mgnify:FL=1|nr:YebC/PmpR family DNA-binding transcriptional regulator [Planctomycetota bacterium]HRU50577.1 YebC/PmpR family DNA-binding transcriptional regulator [Planctomycetota bacterium]
MAGHSHWAGIKHKKGLMDAKRGKIFSKLSKDIMTAVREGGADPTMNIRLRYAMDKARESNMPKANIERAIQKVAGDGQDQKFAELTYEGYGPGGIAIMVDALTDNRNRTASELRNLFESNGGKMGESGCVAYLFDKKGLITILEESIDEEKIIELALEAGADDVQLEGELWEITTKIADFQTVRNKLEEEGVKLEEAEITYIPQTTVEADEDVARKILNMISKMEDHEDVETVVCNIDISDEIMQKIEADDA